MRPYITGFPQVRKKLGKTTFLKKSGKFDIGQENSKFGKRSGKLAAVRHV